MATIKFSEFTAGSITTPGVELVGLDGGSNKRFTASDLVSGLANVSYVDSQDAGLQSQITQNANDIAAIDLSGLQSNVSTLQGQVTVLEGNIVVLESAVAALENNVTINQNDIVTLRGNIVAIENEVANIADTDAQTLTYDGATANLSISNGNNVVLQEVLDNAGNITVIQSQISDLQANGNIQTLSLNNSSNVLSISGGNSVDFTPVLANVTGSGGNPFDQDLNTTDSPTFDNLSTTGELDVNGTGTHTFEGTIQFTQLTNFGGSVGITSILDEDDMVSDSAIALATQQSIKAYVDAAVVSGGGGNYSNANVQALGEAGWAGNIIPSANVTYDLGSATNAWKDLYLSNATIYLGDQTISVNSQGTMEFSGNISAQNIIDETSLIIHDGVINTTQVGTTDGLEWQAIDLPGHSPAYSTTEMASNGSGILAAGQNGQIAYSLDNGKTWELLNPRNDLGFAFSISNIRIHYISSLDTFFIAGSNGYYFTTQDFVSFSGQLRANPGGWSGIQGVTDNGTNLVVISGSRVVHYIPLADLSNQAGWTSLVNNLSSNSGYITYNGTRFVIIEYGSNAQSSTDGVTWVNKTSTGLNYMRGIAHDETGKIVAVGGDNKIAVSTDDGVTWTTTDISSQVEWKATTKLTDVAYGDGLWIVSGLAAYEIQYVSEDLITWSKIQTNAIGGRDISFMSYTGDAFYGQNQDGNYQVDWPAGKQLLLFNGNVIATRSDISYVVASAKVSSAEHVSTAWLTITPDHDGSNANANVSNVAHSEIVFNSADTSLDISSNAQPVARITSGVLVQVHGSWDASSAGSFSWATDEIASHGINTVTRDAAGIYTVEFETPFATNAYTVTTGCGSTDYSGTGARTVSVLTRNAANCTIICERTDDAVNEDNLYMSLMVCGIVATQ